MKDEFILIEKNSSYQNIVEKNIEDRSINLFFYKIALKFFLLIDIKVHHGKFQFNDNQNFIKLLKIITSPSDYYEKLTIVEGWFKDDLNKLLNKNFKNFYELEYADIIADTYFFNEGSSFNDFINLLEIKFLELKKKYENHYLLNKFSFEEIFIIGSLLEKEGLNYDDKRKIYSVIINRLDRKMKLQIDATVIYAINKGSKILERKLVYKDLKIEDPYNTYYIYGLPPTPISYVGYKTIEIIFEDYKTDYLFYFYNSFEKKHIFSKNYSEHLKRLNEYRSKK